MSSLTPEHQKNYLASWAPALMLFVIGVAYIGLSLVAGYKPDWLPASSALHTALLGPPALLVWGDSLTTLYWAATAVIVLLLAAGALLSKLQLPATLLTLVVWLGCGFFAAALSI